MDGSWISDANGSWGNTANWSGGAFPDAGGIATFTSHTTQSGSRTVTLDVNVALSSVFLSSNYQYTIGPGTGIGSLTLTGTADIEVQQNQPATPASAPTGHSISAPIVGTAGLTKTGAGMLALSSGASTFTGGVTVTGGTLRLAGGSGLQDNVLGNAANGISLAGGSIRISTNTWTTSRAISLGTGGGSFQTAVTSTLNGAITGSSALNKAAGTGGSLAIGANNTGFSGAVNVGGGTFVFVGANGAMTAASGYSVSGATIGFDNSTANSNRMSNTAPITLDGGHFRNVGGAGAVDETVGEITLSAGSPVFTMGVGAGGFKLNASALTRTNRATAYIRGIGLGGTPGASVTNLLLGSAPAMVGGGGAPGTNTINIVPWVSGTTSATETTVTGGNFMTYDAVRGLRPLDAAETTPTITDGNATLVNIRTTGSSTTTLTMPTTVNAISFSAGGRTIAASGAGQLNINSGAVILGTTATSAANITAPINFGAAEGIFLANATTAGDGTLNITGVISNTSAAGITKGGNGNLVLGSSNTYTGQTTINAGVVYVPGNLPVNATSAFGIESSAVVFQPDTSTSRILTTTGGTWDRPFTVRGGGSGAAVIGNVTASHTLTLPGQIQLDRPLQFEMQGAQVTIDGLVTGAGRLATDSTSTSTILLTNVGNDFSGGIQVFSANWGAASDNAFGSGTVYFEDADAGGSIFASGGARSLANPLVFDQGTANPRISGSNELTLTGPVTLGNENFPIDVTNSAATTFAGVVSSGRLIKGGSGLLVLSNNANSYTGSTRINDGTLSISSDGNLGAVPAVFDNNGLQFAGGTLRSTADITLSATRGGTISTSGGIDVVGATTLAFPAIIGGTGPLTKFGNGTLVLSGANTYVGATTVNSGSLIIGAGGTTGALGVGNVTNNGNLVIDRSNAYSSSNAIDGSGNLHKNGAGVLTLSGGNTYTGTTAVNQGVLLVNGTHTGGGTYSVNAGGVLGGTGTIGSKVSVGTGGTLAPGASIGVLTVTDDITLEQDSTLSIEVDVTPLTSPGGSSDQLSVLGGVLLGDGFTPSTFPELKFVFTPAAIGAVTPNKTFVIVSNDGVDPVQGEFAGKPDDTLVTAGLLKFAVDYQYDSATSTPNAGNDIAVTFVEVPEPAGAVALAAVSLLYRRRRS